MGKIKVHDMKGKTAGDIEFPDALLVLDKGSQAVRDVVVAFRAGQRAGTASTLSKGEVAGSNKKPWRQKGLGRARAGYRQSPVWRGGAVAFGPKPRSYAKKINRKVRNLAFKRAFSDAVQSGSVMVIDELSVTEARTKLFADIIKNLGIQGTALFVVDNPDENLVKSVRNIPGTEIETSSGVNVYQLLRYKTIVVTKAAMEVIKKRFEGGTAAAQEEGGAE